MNGNEITDEQWQILQEEPVDFIELAFGEDLWSKEREIANSVRDYKYTAVRSCHGAGKSFVSARIANWFLHSFPNSKVITTAPTGRQVEEILWREIRSAREKSRVQLGGRTLNTEIDISPDWFALGLSTDKPDRFQGFHAIHILLIVDEASGVPEEIFDASEGIVSSEHARVLYIGNPTSVEGTFHKAFSMPDYSRIHISAFDTPNLTAYGITLDDIKNDTWRQKITGPLPAPYLITPDWVADKWLRWGEGNPMWDSRVMGEFPQQGEDTLIPLVRIEEAYRRTLAYQLDDPEQIGVDIARYGSDKTIFLPRKGPKVLDLREYNHLDTMATSDNLDAYINAYPNATVAIDVVGVGAGVYDRLSQLRKDRNLFAANVGEKAFNSERYGNLRAEIFWALRERFVTGDIDLSALPYHVYEELAAQLSAIKFRVNNRNQILIESKEDMKKRGLASPDKADALALAYGRLKHQISYAGLSFGVATPVVPQGIEPQPIQATEQPRIDLTDEAQRKAAELAADLAIMRADRR